MNALTPEQISYMKTWIDTASYEMLLRKWRTAPSGDVWFIGEIGDYFEAAMRQRRSQDNAAQISKKIGWE